MRHPIVISGAVSVTALLSASCTHRMAVWPRQTIEIRTASNVNVVAINQKPPLHVGNRDKYYLHRYFVLRSQHPLAVTLQKNDSNKTVYVEPLKTHGWVLNMKYVFGPKNDTDWYMAKRRKFPRKVRLSFADTIINTVYLPPERKGAVYPTFSIGPPQLLLAPQNVHYASAGILAIELGMDYLYRQRSFLSIGVGAGTDVPFSYLNKQDRQSGSTVYLSIRNNHLIGQRFVAGYGLSFSSLSWQRELYDFSNSAVLSVRNSMQTLSIGASISGQFRIGPRVKTGFIYQPGLINFDRQAVLRYQHYIAIQLVLRISKKTKL